MADKQTVEQLKAALPDMDAKQLQDAFEAEKAGDNRTTAIAEIEAELKKRAEASEGASTEPTAGVDADEAARVAAEAIAELAKPAPTSVSPLVAKFAGGELTDLELAFGDDDGPSEVIPPKSMAGSLRADGSRLIYDGAIDIETSDVNEAISLATIFLVNEGEIVGTAELPSPIALSPGMQARFASGTLAFF